jgi:hypothetical protein
MKIEIDLAFNVDAFALPSKSKPKNGQKKPFDPHPRCAKTSGPRKDGFLKAFHATHEHATCIME